MTEGERHRERDVVRMKTANQWIRTPLTTPHSWKVKRNIMQQRGLHLWELDMSWVSEKNSGAHGRNSESVFCVPPPPALFSLLHSFFVMRVKQDLRELQYLTDSDDPLSICIWRFKGRQALPFKEANRCLTTNTSTSRISAPPLSVYPTIHPATFPPAVS